MVAVAMARSIDLMVALLAVVKAGGGYVPVDSTSPVNRVDFVLRDTRPKCVLTTRADGDYILGVEDERGAGFGGGVRGFG